MRDHQEAYPTLRQDIFVALNKSYPPLGHSDGSTIQIEQDDVDEIIADVRNQLLALATDQEACPRADACKAKAVVARRLAEWLGTPGVMR